MYQRWLTMAGLAVLLAGCGVFDVKALREAKPSGGTAFTQALVPEYRAYADYEAEKEYEWEHAGMFARKGLAAAKGEMVMPYEVKDWDIPAARQAELTDARKRLMGYFDTGARERVPALAAKAQVMYDCWLEEEAEGETTSDCRATFLKIEPDLKPKQAAAAPAPAPAAKIVKTYVIYFDFNKADITAEAQKIVAQIAKEQGEIKPTNIFLAGHTDTSGSTAYNQALSSKRAQAAADALAKVGVNAKILDLKAHGEGKLAVQTADNVKEAKNRRVEVYFEK